MRIRICFRLSTPGSQLAKPVLLAVQDAGLSIRRHGFKSRTGYSEARRQGAGVRSQGFWLQREPDPCLPPPDSCLPIQLGQVVEWQTRDAQNVVPNGVGVQVSPWSLESRERRDEGRRNSPVLNSPLDSRFSARVGQCSSGSHKPRPPGATPGPATFISAGYANRQSGEVESLVPVGSTPTSVTGAPKVDGRSTAGLTPRASHPQPSTLNLPSVP